MPGDDAQVLFNAGAGAMDRGIRGDGITLSIHLGIPARWNRERGHAARIASPIRRGIWCEAALAAYVTSCTRPARRQTSFFVIWRLPRGAGGRPAGIACVPRWNRWTTRLRGNDG